MRLSSRSFFALPDLLHRAISDDLEHALGGGHDNSSSARKRWIRTTRDRRYGVRVRGRLVCAAACRPVRCGHGFDRETNHRPCPTGRARCSPLAGPRPAIDKGAGPPPRRWSSVNRGIFFKTRPFAACHARNKYRRDFHPGGTSHSMAKFISAHRRRLARPGSQLLRSGRRRRQWHQPSCRPQ
jgi:hypothetical protein